MMQQDDMDHKGMLIENPKNAMNGSNQSIYWLLEKRNSFES